MSVAYDFGLIGGDMRQVYCACILASKGYKVITYGLEHPADCAKTAESMEELVTKSSVLLGPIPFAKNKNEIFCKTVAKPLPVHRFVELTKNGQSFFAGCIQENLEEKLLAKQVLCVDLMKDEELTIFNSIATAEGAIAEAVLASDDNLSHSRCLVLGYGRCAKTLAAFLKGLFCHVAVCARKPSDRALAAVTADQVMDFESLPENLKEFSFIFNTVPNLILDSSMLCNIHQQAAVIDLASAPGGVDYQAARNLQVNARHCLGLPGKYAPKASGEAIVETVLRSLKKK